MTRCYKQLFVIWNKQKFDKSLTKIITKLQNVCLEIIINYAESKMITVIVSSIVFLFIAFVLWLSFKFDIGWINIPHKIFIYYIFFFVKTSFLDRENTFKILIKWLQESILSKYLSYPSELRTFDLNDI